MFQILKPRRAKALTVALAAVAALIIAGSATAVNGIMLQVKDAPLKEVVMLLTQQSGTNIVIADDSKLEKKITANLTDIPLENALDHIVKGAGVSVRKTEDGTYIIGGALPQEPAISLQDVAAALPPVDIPVQRITSQESQMVVVKLIHSKPSELLRLIGWEGKNPMPNCEPIYPESLVPSNTVQNSPNSGFAVMNSNGQVYDPSQMLRQQNNQPVVPTIDPSSLNRGAGRVADMSTGAAQYPPNASSNRPPGYNPAYGTRGTTPSTPTAPSSTASSSSNFLWPEGIDDAKPFDLDNSIIVKGTEDGIEKFKKIVHMLDVPPKQVQIKAEFIEVSTNDVKKFGIDWSLERLNESFETTFGPTGNVILGFTSGNLTALLKAQLTSTVGRIVNSPIISTINNQNAQIQISDVIPYWQSVTVLTDGTTNTSYQANFLNINTLLNVLPRVNGDGTITMQLMPQVSDAGTMYEAPDGQSSIPEQRTQSLYTQRRVRNGETIVVGGFIRKSDSNSYQSIPILADLPIVGSLFRTHSRTNEDRELLIFVTPTIIADSSTGTIGDSLIP